METYHSTSRISRMPQKRTVTKSEELRTFRRLKSKKKKVPRQKEDDPAQS